MADNKNPVNSYVEAIKNAALGTEVRDAIANGIKQCYSESQSALNLCDYTLNTVVGDYSGKETYHAAELPEKTFAALQGELGDTLTMPSTTNFECYSFDTTTRKLWRARIRHYAGTQYTHYIYGVNASNQIVYTAADTPDESDFRTFDLQLPATATRLYVMSRVYANFEVEVWYVSAPSLLTLISDIDANTSAAVSRIEALATDTSNGLVNTNAAVQRLETSEANTQNGLAATNVAVERLGNSIGSYSGDKAYIPVELPERTSGALKGELGEQINFASTTNYAYYAFDTSSRKAWHVTTRQYNTTTYTHYIYGVDSSGKIVYTNADTQVDSGDYSYEFELPAAAVTMYVMHRTNSSDTFGIQASYTEIPTVFQAISSVRSLVVDDTEELRKQVFNSKIKDVMDLQLMARRLSIALITDTHVIEEVDNHHCINNIRLFTEIANRTDCAVHCGDVIQGTDLTRDESYKNMLTAHELLSNVKSPLFVAHGNHEINARYVSGETWTTDATPDENEIIPDSVFNSLFQTDWMIKREHVGGLGNYFFTDYDSFKIRVIIVNDYCGSTRDEQHSIGADQLDWLVNKALNFTDKSDPGNWLALVFKHSNNVKDAITDSGLALKDVFAAFMQGTAIASSYGVSSPFSTQGAIPLVVIHGHVHNDYFLNNDGFCKIAVDRSFVMRKDKDESTGAGWIGTEKEYCCSVFTIDTVNHVIYETRFGRGADRVFSYGAYGKTHNYQIS